MKILLAAPHFPPRRLGGVEWEVLRIARGLQARGHQIRVVCVEDVDRVRTGAGRWVDDEHEGIAVRRLSLELGGLPPRGEYDNGPVGAQVDRLLVEDRPDVLHLYSGYLISASPLLAARARAVPAVVSLTDLWFLCPRIQMLRSDGGLSTVPVDPVRCARCLAEERRRYRIPGRLAPGLRDWFWRRQAGRIREVEDRVAFLRGALAEADAILSRSAYVRSMFVAASAVERGRITFVQPGRSAPHHGWDRPLKSSSDVLRLGYLGQISPHKGVHVLVDAVRRIPDARLTLDLHGDWQQFPAYARQVIAAAGADSRIRCKPRFTGDRELAELHRDFDVLVMPSLWYEVSPTVILEAFVHHTPVVASDLGGCSELVIDGVNGLLFAAGDAASLAGALRRLVDEPGLRARLSEGIPTVRSQEEEVSEIETIYQRITNR